MSINSDEYNLRQTKGALADGRNANAKVKRFEFTVSFGISPGAAPGGVLCTVPAGAKNPRVYINSSGLSASAGVAATVAIGDAGSATRLVTAFDADVAEGNYYGVNHAAADYEYTAQTDITYAVASGKTPANASKLKGHIDVILND